MIYKTPKLEASDLIALEMVAGLRKRLENSMQSYPQRWLGSLRRAMFAKAIQGSNSIEGIHANIDTAIAAIQQEPPLDEKTEIWMAINGYQSAMTYIMQAAKDQYFEFSKQFLKSLHFMISSYSMNNHPGQWRSGSVFVVDSKTGQTVYEPPPAEMVDSLITELVDYLKNNPGDPEIVCAAMAHLNLTMIHPFKDGNGRVARALQTLVIAREGILHPVFSSIEEWLGDNTQEYYNILATTGEGRWNPSKDATNWVRFCIKAHFQQAAKLIRRNEEAASLYEKLSKISERENLPDRAWNALFDAALGLRVTNLRYRTDAEITDYTASRDLKRMSELGLLVPQGEKRARTYVAAKPITDAREATRIRRPLEDPYEIIAKSKLQDQKELPF